MASQLPLSIFLSLKEEKDAPWPFILEDTSIGAFETSPATPSHAARKFCKASAGMCSLSWGDPISHCVWMGKSPGSPAGK